MSMARTSLRLLSKTKQARALHGYMNGLKITSHSAEEIVTKDFKRGDNVAVKIMPFDGEKYGNPKVLTTEIKNTVPRIVEDKIVTFDGKQLSYQVKAMDADGDSLTYSLVEGPPGVTIDQKSGIITWSNVPEDKQKLDLKVKINDGHIGEIIYPLTVNFSQVVKEKLTVQK